MRVAIRKLEKRAVTVSTGGLPSQLVADTLGRLVTAPYLAFDHRWLQNPALTRARREAVRRDAERLAGVTGDALSNTHIRLGGTDLIDDVLWRRRVRGEAPRPWKKRIGGRLWQNPRVGVPMKVLGTVLVPLNNRTAALTRGTHYNLLTDTVVKFDNDPAVTEHELGHAIDFNTAAHPTGRISSDPEQRRADRKKLMEALMRPVLTMEQQANQRSEEALRKALKDDPELLRERLLLRAKTLPAAYWTYEAPVWPYGLPILGEILALRRMRQISREAVAAQQKEFEKEDRRRRRPRRSVSKRKQKRRSRVPEGRPMAGLSRR